MTTVRATVQGGRVDVLVPGGLADGTEVLVEIRPIVPEKIGITESEWRDDPESLADRDAWLATIEPIELTCEERADLERFEEEFRRHNVEAVRKQMEGGTPG